MIHSERQFRRFSVRTFINHVGAGFKLIWYESICLLWQQIFDWKNLSVFNRPVVRPHEGCSRRDLDQETGVAYGYSQIAKLFASNIMWIPAYILDASPGQYVSNSFAIANHIVVLICGAYFTITAQYFLGPLFDASYRGLNEVFPRIWTSGALVTMNCIIIHGCITLMWIIKQRHYIHDFILYDCSKFRVGKNYQQSRATRTYAITWVTAIFAEPLFLSLLVYDSLSQDNGFLQHYSAISFYLTKTAAFGSFTYGIFCAHISMNAIPIMTSFVIMVISKHIKTVLDEHTGRRRYSLTTSSTHNSDLLSRVHEYEARLIYDYGCDTLTMNWPVIDEHTDQCIVVPVGKDTASGASASINHARKTIAIHTGKSLRQSSTIVPEPNSSIVRNNDRPIVGSELIFSYRSLVKLLSETKRLIRSYERRFGWFHLLQIYLMGFLCAHWIVSGLAEMRVWLGDHIKVSETRESVWTSNSLLIVSRACISISLYIITNVITFVRADRLPQQLAKMRSQLFKINLELVLVAIEDTQRKELDRPDRIDKRKYSIFDTVIDSEAQSRAVDWPELDQVWSLYDQIVRMTHRVNFRLGNNLHYNKNTLFKLIGREISLILLYVQLIHIYSNAVS